MKKFLLVALALLSSIPAFGQDVIAQRKKAFVPLDLMREVKPPVVRKFTAPKYDGLLPVSLPIDWTKGGALKFPMHGNDRYGDCYYAAACHADETWTGMIGPQYLHDDAKIISAYTRLSGGDNGLNDRDIQGEWTNRGLAGVADAKILDYLYLDPTDTGAMQSAAQNCLVVMFTLGVPNNWLDTEDGDKWDVPANGNKNNGHAVMINRVDKFGNYGVQTWGGIRWMTPAGVRVCYPDAWVAFSTRAFSKSTGRAGNGLHIAKAAANWKAAGGKTIPAAIIAQYPPETSPTPTPATRSITLKGFGPAIDGTYPLGPMVP